MWAPVVLHASDQPPQPRHVAAQLVGVLAAAARRGEGELVSGHRPRAGRRRGSEQHPSPALPAAAQQPSRQGSQELQRARQGGERRHLLNAPRQGGVRWLRPLAALQEGTHSLRVCLVSVFGHLTCAFCTPRSRRASSTPHVQATPTRMSTRASGRLTRSQARGFSVNGES